MKKRYILSVLLFAFILGGCGQTDVKEAPQTNKTQEQTSQEVNVQLTITQNEGKDIVTTKEVVAEEGQSVLDVMKANFALTTAYDDSFITGIDGLLADDKKQLAWIFYINGETAMKGARDITLQSGDEVTFSLEAWK